MGAVTLGVSPPTDPGTPVILSVVATSDSRVELVHRGGRPLAVEDLRLDVPIDSEPLAHPSPIAFVGAPGFRDAPTGPFNDANAGRWTTGERAGVVVAGTIAPALSLGATLHGRSP